ncbi:hypothetical protein L227DRAFT_107754 [Lentinus tigrinus ALCF2SS1-6]|uniref:Uncharacterized protein n=1 Tax=Lentinus tigrinus ALCF2SS1-6 TaxID=1328759 RepID=A0A5C2S8L4_9APHY|nr:hypothetical protein L227DRAFT_107754 [Lentinus tigrinus ALCF2SS1-6]
MAYVELAGAPANACYLVKCDNCGKTTWKVRNTFAVPPPSICKYSISNGRSLGPPRCGSREAWAITRTDGSRIRFPSVPKGARSSRVQES